MKMIDLVSREAGYSPVKLNELCFPIDGVGLDVGFEPVTNIRGDGTVPSSSSRPAEWAGEDEVPSHGRVQGFSQLHAELQNADTLLDSLFQILTADKLGQTAGGRFIGIPVPAVVKAGQPVAVDVFAEPTADNLSLAVFVDDADLQSCSLANLGGNRYQGRITELPLDTHNVQVASIHWRNPVNVVDAVITVVSDSYASSLVDTEATAG